MEQLPWGIWHFVCKTFCCKVVTQQLARVVACLNHCKAVEYYCCGLLGSCLLCLLLFVYFCVPVSQAVWAHVCFCLCVCVCERERESIWFVLLLLKLSKSVLGGKGVPSPHPSQKVLKWAWECWIGCVCEFVYMCLYVHEYGSCTWMLFVVVLMLVYASSVHVCVCAWAYVCVHVSFQNVKVMVGLHYLACCFVASKVTFIIQLSGDVPIFLCTTTVCLCRWNGHLQ